MTPIDDSAWEPMRQAVALLTAWNESHEGDMSFLAGTVNHYAANATSIEEVVEIFSNLVAGLVSLSGGLLLELGRASGQTPSELLAIIGRRTATWPDEDDHDDDDL
jgi:hypothetical protein